MSKYIDISSYNLAIKLRSHKTILVEGPTDKQVLSSLFLARNYLDNINAKYCVDDVAMVADKAELSHIGNREKIIKIAEKLSSKNSKLGYLIDREWDDVNLSSCEPAEISLAHNNTFKTKGHSIENYWFRVDAIISFLQQFVAVSTTSLLLRSLEEKFDLIIRFAAAYSLAANEGHIITRLDDLLTYNDVEYTNNEFILKPTFLEKLALRNSAYDIVSSCNSRVTNFVGINSDHLRWISHGHLGEQAIRACVARIGLDFGLDHAALSEIERGDRAGKFKHDSKHITTYTAELLEPLEALLDWVRNPD